MQAHVRAGRHGWRAVFTWLVMAGALVVTMAATAATLQITPSGDLPGSGSVKVVVTARYDPARALESFDVWYNGQNITPHFLRYAALTQPDSATVVATVELLFPPGDHRFNASLKFAGEPVATADTTFRVRDSDQTRMRQALIARIDEFLHQHDAYDFARAISLGDIGAFSARAAEPSFQIYVDRDYLAYGTKEGSAAAYVELYFWGLSYYRDLVLGNDPELFGLGKVPEQEFSPLILWHEMIHAISHLATVTGSPNRLPPPPGGKDEDVDHYYLWWAERCLSGGIARLRTFEQHAKASGRSTPSPEAAAVGRTTWRQFVSICDDSSDLRGAPPPQQRLVFRQLTGFHIDAATVKAHYLSLGYSPLYFDATAVSMLTPTDGSRVDTEEVDASARLTVDPGTRIGQVGFVINGVVQYGTLVGGDLIIGTLPLRMGANQIQGGAVTLDASGVPASAVLSPAITVTRVAAPQVCPQVTTWTDTDQSLYAPLRITRVEHSNRPGAYYFYVFHPVSDRQERSILVTYFTLSAAPSLTRDYRFDNNVTVSLISMPGAAGAATIWSREMAGWDARPAGSIRTELMRDATTLVFGWTGSDGMKHVESMSLVHGSLIVKLGVASTSATDTIPLQGLASLQQRALTAFGLADVKCGGR